MTPAHTWTSQQQAALDKARRWLDAPLGTVPQVFTINGFAGTGKSSLAHELNAHVGHRALAAAYTGKAASVMAAKGLPNATTVHRLIYNPAGADGKHLKELKEELRLLEAVADPSPKLIQRAEAVRRAVREAEEAAKQPRFILKDESAVSDVPLVILDECPMVDERMGTDLCSFGTRILALGDPGQLPPIRGAGYFVTDSPDVMLTEIHRQAEGSGILRLATRVRQGLSLDLCDWGEARVVDGTTAREALAADQMLCGTNARRRAINHRQRGLVLGERDTGGIMPLAGEKLVCLRNDHDLGLLNGTQWVTTQDADWDGVEDVVGLHIEPFDGGAEMLVPACASIFRDEDLRPRWGGSDQEFTFGYAMTVHKAQGSQWGSVIVFDDWTNTATRRQWLYTAVTRAAEKLTVVRM